MSVVLDINRALLPDISAFVLLGTCVSQFLDIDLSLLFIWTLVKRLGTNKPSEAVIWV